MATKSTGPEQFGSSCTTIFSCCEVPSFSVLVLNILGFDRAYACYLPDRRDLNRCFPGSARGLASRMARTIFDEIVSRCDYGIDLHTAAVRRTNYPNVRVDLANPDAGRLAVAFGCEIILSNKGPRELPAPGSLSSRMSDDHHGRRRSLESGTDHRGIVDPRHL
ncbi:MAG: succinylglutamate desuccinylase/aspartoacylase family protein [Planctomycetaceae bacterium]